MLLEIQNLTKSFTRNGAPFFPVKDVNLTAEAGQFISISGHSGCGKSTLLNLMTGMLTPDAGIVAFDGENVFEMSTDRLAAYLNQDIAYIMQGDGLLHSLSVRDNIALVHAIHHHEDIPHERIIQLAQSLGIEKVLASYPSQLSGGETKRVAIARALLNQPKLIVADEPTCNLDPRNGENILEIFKNLCDDGTAVIVSTHDRRFSAITDYEYVFEDH